MQGSGTLATMRQHSRSAAGGTLLGGGAQGPSSEPCQAVEQPPWETVEGGASQPLGNSCHNGPGRRAPDGGACRGLGGLGGRGVRPENVAAALVSPAPPGVPVPALVLEGQAVFTGALRLGHLPPHVCADDQPRVCSAQMTRPIVAYLTWARVGDAQAGCNAQPHLFL